MIWNTNDNVMEKVPGGTELLNPLALLQRLHIDRGMVVADLGCGRAGFFAIQAGKIIGEQGTVYAVDVVKAVLSSVSSAIKQSGLRNVKTVWADLEVPKATKIPDRSSDIALLVNVLFQSRKREAIIREAARVLKPGGKLLVIDWKTVNSPLGPPQERRVSPDTVRVAARNLGLLETDSFEAGQYHFGLIFSKK